MKVALVHEQHAVCTQLTRALEQEGLVVQWTAQDAASAARELSNARVDVVFWSVRIAGMQAAVRHGAQVLAMYARDQELAAVDDAMAAGAVLSLNLAALADKHELHARLATLRRLTGKGSLPAQFAVPLVAIGASTGGPQALATLCAGLPATFPGALVVVQHIEAAFMPELSTTLAAGTGLRVTFAEDGVLPEAGTIHVAAEPRRHLVLDAQRRFRYVAAPADAVHRPSVDVLFESLAQHGGPRGTAILLTGMGRDGARGLGLLRRAGWRTIAQDAQSSVVYGMPRAAVEEGAASEVLALTQIAPALLRSR